MSSRLNLHWPRTLNAGISAFCAIVYTVLSATFMSGFDANAVYVALPSLHREFHAGAAELVERVIEQRAARDLHQGLWHPVRQRAHAQAKAGGENHGFGGLDGHLENFSNRYLARRSCAPRIISCDSGAAPLVECDNGLT